MRLSDEVTADCAGLLLGRVAAGELLHRRNSEAAPRHPYTPDASAPLAESPTEATREPFLRVAILALEVDSVAEASTVEGFTAAAVVSFFAAPSRSRRGW